MRKLRKKSVLVVD